MNTQMARALTAQHNDELTTAAARNRAAASIPAPRRRVPHWRVPHWRVNWSRTTLAPVGTASTASGAGRAHLGSLDAEYKAINPGRSVA